MVLILQDYAFHLNLTLYCILCFWANIALLDFLKKLLLTAILYHFFIHLITLISYYRSSHWRCSIKNMFLKISQNSQESTCAKVSFLIKSHIKKRDSVTGVFLWTPFLQNISSLLVLMPSSVYYIDIKLAFYFSDFKKLSFSKLYWPTFFIIKAHLTSLLFESKAQEGFSLRVFVSQLLKCD